MVELLLLCSAASLHLNPYKISLGRRGVFVEEYCFCWCERSGAVFALAHQSRARERIARGPEAAAILVKTA
jgi:hypothetical protein